ncbi:MAG: hypothetical protein EP344_19520 [Bacteroidetes bacterium]|nr:MAG: hypothetical protein EP344_19520 [Bacteroidota bacterium]
MTVAKDLHRFPFLAVPFKPNQFEAMRFMSAKLRSGITISVLAAAFAVAVYLLWHHYTLSAGRPVETSFCSAVFNHSCDGALLSRYALLFGIPLGGWGIIYTVLLGLCLLLGAWLPDNYNSNMAQTAFWMAVAGGAFSAYYLLSMALHPFLLCPMCVVFHLLNFSLLGLLRAGTGASLSTLARGLIAAGRFVLAGRQMQTPFAAWKWLGFVLLGVTGLVLYQRIRMQGLHQQISRLASYDPLADLEAFDTSAVHTIPALPDDPVLGPPDAPVSMVVFSDFQCSACQLFSGTFHNLVKYNEGRLNIRFKHFPLSNQCNPGATQDVHPLSCMAAQAAEAAHRQGEFWAFHDAVFSMSLDQMDAGTFLDSIRGLVPDPVRFQTDFTADSSRQKVAQDIQEALHLGVNSTPAVFLNGRRLYDLRPNKLNLLVRYLSRANAEQQ